MLDAEEMGEADGTGALTLATLATDGELPKMAFRDVSFGYGDEPLMERFDLEVSEGATVAIVGRTGAGKTTLINLLERFYDVDGGAFELDGADIASLSREEVRGRMGMVLQDPWLFTGTIYDNIAYGNTDAAPEQVRAAAKAAYADEFVRVVKPRKVELFDDAVEDLRAIRGQVYRASKSKQVADNYLKRIRHRLRPLEYGAAAYPRYFYQGGKDSGSRFCVTENHVAFFTFDEERVRVKRVLHKRMNFDDTLVD